MYLYDFSKTDKLLAWCCTNQRWEVMTGEQFEKQPQKILPPFNGTPFGGCYTSEVPSMDKQIELFEEIMKRPPCTC